MAKHTVGRSKPVSKVSPLGSAALISRLEKATRVRDSLDARGHKGTVKVLDGEIEKLEELLEATVKWEKLQQKDADEFTAQNTAKRKAAAGF